MLDSLPKFAELLLSNNAGLLPRITTASEMQAGSPRLTPQDPSTLALALVGMGTLVLYLAVSGWRRSRSDEERALRPRVDASNKRTVSEQTETPKRGAA